VTASGTTPSTTDPLARLKLVRELMSEHGGICPKCRSSALNETDELDEDRDAVARTWECPGCGYSRRGLGIPISKWKTSDQDRWYRKAAGQRARDALIRCPTCGNESIKATESGVAGVGTSSHVILSCKTYGCEFEERSIERSIKGTARSEIRVAVLVGILLAAGLLATKVKSLFERTGESSKQPVQMSTAMAESESSGKEGHPNVATPWAIGAAAVQSPPPSPLTISWSGQVRGSTRGPLISGMKLRSGDGISLNVMTSVPANVYLLYCNGKGVLSIFPPSGSLKTAAMASLTIPGANEELTLDSHAG
jgi:hypothetical protein